MKKALQKIKARRVKRTSAPVRHWRVPAWAMVLVLALEIAAIYRVFKPDVRSERGYLIKLGQTYVLGWREDTGVSHQVSYDNLRAALNFARDELKLLPGRNPMLVDELEHLWTRTGAEGEILYFKTTQNTFLNRMTFASVDDARTFQRIFKQGAYSPSPLGHAINLVPFQY